MGSCICPKCKSDNVVPIWYGYPSRIDAEAAERGEIILGGDIIYDKDGCGMDDRYCKECEYSWSVNALGAEDILKVRFRYWSSWGCYDSESTQEAQWAFNVLPDGTITYTSHPRASRRVLDKTVVKISKGRILEFYQRLIWLYRPWTKIVEYDVCDGNSYELTITYKDNRKRTFHGDIGGGTVDDTVMQFLGGIPGINEKIR